MKNYQKNCVQMCKQDMPNTACRFFTQPKLVSYISPAFYFIVHVYQNGILNRTWRSTIFILDRVGGVFNYCI